MVDRARSRAQSSPRVPKFEFGDEDQLQLDNPLIHMRIDEVRQYAIDMVRFMGRHKSDEEIFARAAEVARDPPNWERVSGLSKKERDALQQEKYLGFLSQPKALIVTVSLLCLSALTQGWVESTSNVANLTWPSELQIEHRLWIVALCNAIPFLAGGLCALLFADPCMMLGRRGILFISGVLCLVGSVGASASRGWKQLLIFRAILGIGLGAKASMTATFAAEVSPSHLRGTIVLSWQLFVALGIASGFLAAVIVRLIGLGGAAWRWQTVSVMLPLLPMLALTLVISESPRYLLKKGRLSESFHAFCALRETPLQAARDLIYINAQIQTELAFLPARKRDRKAATKTQESKRPGSSSDSEKQGDPQANQHFVALQDRLKRLGYWTRLGQIFLNLRTSRATRAACIVMLAQQLCGINILMFYSSNFLHFPTSDALDDIVPYWLNFGVGLVNFFGTIPAYFAIDSRGRRFLLLIMYPIMALTMMAASLSFLHTNENSAAVLVIVFVFLFVLAYSIGQGPVAFTYASEVFPLVYREVGFGFAVLTNFLGMGVLLLLVPPFQMRHLVSADNDESLPRSYWTTQSKILGAFAIMNVIAMLLIFFLVPETAGTVIDRKQGKLASMSLEEMNYIFGEKTWHYARYQVEVMVPWLLRKARRIVCCLFTDRWDDPAPPEQVWTWVPGLDSNESGSTADVPEKGGTTLVNGTSPVARAGQGRPA